MKVQFLDLGRQHIKLKNEIGNALKRVISSNNFILGNEIEKFEKDFAKFCKAKHCVSLSSGTDALELSLQALGIKPNDEVITVPHTFIANVESIFSVGAKPVFCEIDSKTFTINTNRLKNLITKKTKAIMPVDLYGQPCDLDDIMELAAKYNLAVIEDACQSHGAEYKGRKVGSNAHATAFSFYPGKNLGAFCDSGCITTNDAELDVKIKAMRNHGRLQNEKYRHDIVGGNYRMDELQAAILNVKLKYLKEWTNARRRVASRYRESINAKYMEHPLEASYARHAYHLYVIKTKKRDKLGEYLKSKGISTSIHYPLPLHLQPALKFLGYKKGDFKVTEECANTVLSLPIYPELRNDEVEYVSRQINIFFGK